MSLLTASVLLHHSDEPLTARREVEVPREALDMASFPKALGLDADVLHDGEAMFGAEHPLIRLEARRAELPEGWQWTEEAAPPLADARPWQQPGFFARTWPRLRGWQSGGPAHLISSNDLNVVLSAGEGAERVFLKLGRVRRPDGPLSARKPASRRRWTGVSRDCCRTC